MGKAFIDGQKISIDESTDNVKKNEITFFLLKMHYTQSRTLNQVFFNLFLMLLFIRFIFQILNQNRNDEDSFVYIMSQEKLKFRRI
jgi:hypothetical protein